MANILFTNANLLLNGFAELQSFFNMLVKDNYIHSVSPTPIDCREATVINVAGRTLMPGLIDAHAHITGLSLSPKNVSYPASNIALAAVDYLARSLMDGFTTIREAGGAGSLCRPAGCRGESADRPAGHAQSSEQSEADHERWGDLQERIGLNALRIA